MKKSGYSLVLILVAFYGFTQSRQVDFVVSGIQDSTVYIGYYFGNQKYVLDTLAVQDDRFSLILPSEEIKPGLYFIYTPNYFLEFVLEDKSYSIKAVANGGYKEVEVSGSLENELFKTFQLELGALQREQRSLSKTLKEGGYEDSLRAVTRIKEVAQEMDAFRSKMSSEYPESFTVAFLRMMEDVDVPAMNEITDQTAKQRERYQYYRTHYFDLMDLSDNRLLRTPLLYPKVMKYFEEVVVQHPDTLKKELDLFFNEIGDEPELYRFWLVSFFKKYAESQVMGMDAVMIHLIENYYLNKQADWVTDEYEKKLREEVAYVKPNLLGKKAPALNVVGETMDPFHLEEVNSPYTLLFIYDPDCGHCKKTIKEIEKYDQELSALNVQVVAVCTVTDVERWRTFVSEANPTWLHAIDPTGKSYFRVTYNVRSTPKIYLLNEEKRIIAKQLDISQIVDFVQKTKP